MQFVKITVALEISVDSSSNEAEDIFFCNTQNILIKHHWKKPSGLMAVDANITSH